MNKRNTILLTIVLAVLVVLLIGKFVKRNSRTEVSTQKVDCLYDLNMPTGFDSATIESCKLPIVVHYPNPMIVNGRRTNLHVFSLSADVLANMVSIKGKTGVVPDSINGIHIYPKFLRSKTVGLYLGIYQKVTISQDVAYYATFPVRDRSGVHVFEDSGKISSEIMTKSYGMEPKEHLQKESENHITQQIEQMLVEDVAKKMKRN